jgi:hypothetical protein
MLSNTNNPAPPALDSGQPKRALDDASGTVSSGLGLKLLYGLLALALAAAIAVALLIVLPFYLRLAHS